MKWISINERLPEELLIVIAFTLTLDSENHPSGDFHFSYVKNHRWLIVNNGDGHMENDYMQKNFLKEITHWMPLPKPPQGTEDGMD